MINICNGTYSPVCGFMDEEEIHYVLDKNSLVNNVSWTMPIIFQCSKKEIKKIPVNGETVGLKSKSNGKIIGIMKIRVEFTLKLIFNCPRFEQS